MALTTAKSFGDFVLEGDGGSVSGMGALTEFTTNPLLDPALRFAASLAYAKYLKGDLGGVGAVLDGNFGARAIDVARSAILPAVGRTDLRQPWDNNATFQDAFRAACVEAFGVYKS